MTDHDPERDVPSNPPGEPTQPLQGHTRPIPPQAPPAPPPEQPPAAVPRPAGRSNPLTAIDPGELPLYAAAALVVAVIALAFGSLLVASSINDFGDDEWKIIVKTIGLGTSVGLGFSSGGSALFAALALLAAQFLVGTATAGRRALVPFIGIGTLAVAVWLAFFTVLGILVDFTFFADDFVPALGLLLSDIGALAVLLVAIAWGYQTFRPRA